MRKQTPYAALLLLSAALLCGCQKQPSAPADQPTLTLAPTPSLEPTEALPTTAPTKKPTPTPTPVPDYLSGATLLNTYANTFGYVGTCINLSQLQSDLTLKKVKEQYNSVTLENENKPDTVLGANPSLISVSEAKEKGYLIPENYTEETIPELHFKRVDATLKICAENGLAYRSHTLIWHSQTPAWFFHEDYDAKKEVVTPEVMDARIEYFVRNSIHHIYTGEYGDIVYAWDVLNEYVHATNSGYEKVYGNTGTTPAFVKLAFQVADDELKKLGFRDKVSLFYNDFNCYIDSARILAVANFINSEEKLCDGIGMQSHLKTDYPGIALYKATMKKFLDAGFEVQVTELDVGCSNFTTQGKYYYDLMKAILELKKEGGNITSLTYWGISDVNSWRSSDKPLLFGYGNKPKDAYYQVLQAYLDAGYEISK